MPGPGGVDLAVLAAIRIVHANAHEELGEDDTRGVVQTRIGLTRATCLLLLLLLHLVVARHINSTLDTVTAAANDIIIH